MNNFKDFDYLNSVIMQIFFDGRFNQLPVYLDIEDKYIEELSLKGVVHKEEFIKELSKALLQTLDWNHKNIYHWHEDKLNEWKKKDYAYEPPFLGLLVILSYAAEQMKTDENWSAINYFQRLADVLGVDDHKKIILRDSSKFTQVLWEELNEWLRKKDYSLGIPTASPVFKGWKYVSYAISQSLIRDVDRTNLRKLFSYFNFTNQERLDGSIDKYLNHWMATTDPSKWLRRLWSIPELQEKIIETTLSEFEKWKIEVKNVASSKKIKTTNLSWIFSYEDFPKEKISFYMTSSIVDFENPSLSFKQEKDKIIANENASLYMNSYDEFGFSVLEPFQDIKINQLFNKSIELILDDLTLTHNAKPIIIFSKMPNGMYQEVSSTSLIHPHAIMCNKNFADSINKFLSANCNEGYFQLNENVDGCIEDWAVFLNVVFINIPTEFSSESLRILAPASEKLNLYFDGGLNLLSNIWHSKNPPNIICTDGEENFSISFQILGESLVNLLDQNKNVKSQLDSIDNKSVNIRGLDYDHNKVLIEKTISFRSANNPRILPLELNKKIGITEESKCLFSSEYISNEIENSTSGYLINFKKMPDANIDLSKYQNFKIKNSYKIVDEVFIYNAEKSNHPDDKSCVYRGYHIWKCPPDPRDPRANKANEAISEYTMECMDCGSIHPIIRKKNKRLKTSAPRSSNLIAQDRKKIIFIQEDKKVSLDDIFDALCFAQCGKGYLLRKIVDAAQLEPFKLKNLIDNFVNLGHIEIKKNANNQIDFWSVSPSVLIVRKREIFISGFRNDDLINNLSKCFLENLSLVTNKELQDCAPSKIFWTSTYDLDINKIYEIVANFNNARKETIHVMQDVGSKLLKNLKRFNEYFSFNNKSNVDITSEFEKFNTITGDWIRSKVDSKGAYRIKGIMNQYYFFDGENFIYAPHEMVKIKAALIDNQIIHEYDEATREFRSLINAEPPGFYKKVLISESGKVPFIRDNKKVFSNINSNVGLMLLHKLYE